MTCPEVPVIHSAAVETFTMDLSTHLLGTDTLTGTPTITVSPSSGVTLSAKTVNGSSVTIGTVTVAASEGVQWRGSGWTANTLYEFTVSCATVGGNTVAEKAKLQVLS